MNEFLNKMERKIGRYAINNLTLYIIIGYVIGYLLLITGPLEFISLNPYKILHGQIWRIVTWIVVPPSGISIFTIIMLIFYYSLGTTLEKTWGAFRYNIYIISGMLFTLIGAFILYAYYVSSGVPAEYVGTVISQAFSTYYINLSIFLAFAALYPDMQVMLYFIIPLKIKWLAIVDAVFIAFNFFAGGLGAKVSIIASLLNFIIFFFGTMNIKRFSPKEVKRKTEFRKQAEGAKRVYKSSDGRVTVHKCAICGRTELDGDNLEFRFCSKCNGNYEYCQDHLFTHEHRK